MCHPRKRNGRAAAKESVVIRKFSTKLKIREHQSNPYNPRSPRPRQKAKVKSRKYEVREQRAWGMGQTKNQLTKNIIT